MRLGESSFSGTPKTWVEVPGGVEVTRPKRSQAANENKIVVYTALFGDEDQLWSVPPVAAQGAKFVVFTEKPRREVGLWTYDFSRACPAIIEGTEEASPPTRYWEQRIVKAPYDSRKSARYYKAMAHKVLRGVDVSIWVDANVRLLLRPGAALKQWMGQGELATLDHPDRRCLFREASSCLRQGKGDGRRIAAQVKAYRKAGMPREWGLAETRCLIRRHTKQMAKLNELWWEEIKRYSVRDQISFSFACWKLGISWEIIPGNAKRHKEFWFVYHQSRLKDRR